MSESPASSTPAPSGSDSAVPGPEAAAADMPAATSATTADLPAFGWSAYAERINGRFAMVGFVAVLLIEAISGDTFLHWAGLVP
ncbi:MAG: chlorophyll a/b-binding protein [Cyanobium sp.]